ncbi:MAG: efflux RND transporter periplasmic adaptor subunit [Pirellulales bacterium]|nr:efflux RND transporter periplasmic adaptor subunit [Pirellulales bacterium]
MRTPGQFILLRLLFILLLGIYAAGCRKSPVASTSPLPPKVEVRHPIVRELIDEDEFNGWIESSSVVEVRSRVRGHIQKIHFQDGDRVQAGQPLFDLDPRPFQVQVDQAIAHSRSLEAQKAAAKKNVERYLELIKTGAISKKELEKTQADVESYDAQIAAKKEEVKQYELDLEYAQIRAPITGRISRTELTEGNLVNAGGSDPLLTTIVATDPMYVYFSVDERSLQRYMKARKPAEADQTPGTLREANVPFRFALDSDEGFPHQGFIDFADNRVDPDTGTIRMRGVVENPQGLFVSGSRVRVRLPVSEPYSAVVVPDTAILSDQDRRYLLVVDAKNSVARRDVSLGKLLDDGMRVILPEESGKAAIDSKERIIVQGLQRARINYEVQPVESPSHPES